MIEIWMEMQTMILHEPVTTRVGMPMDEFIRQFDEQPFELINGERKLLMPNSAGHTDIIGLLARLLNIFSYLHKIKITVYSEGTFVLADTPNWVKGSRVPDIMVFAGERVDAYKAENPNWRDVPFIIVPDLCVEVVSENDKMNDVSDKVEAYLRDGVRLVWVIMPKTRTITIRELGSQQATILYSHDTLTGGTVVPGFSVKVSEVFGED
jgi:Uma2 family endonuclease